jgi:transcriptional regulator with XRE-family HTH domain
MLLEQARERLIVLRNQHGLTDAGWARAAGLVQQEVSRFTTREMKFPKLDFMDKLARVFHCTLADVLAKDLPRPSLSKQQITILANLKGMKPAQRAALEEFLSGTSKGGTG